LISGDVFDQANPSNEALDVYFGFIEKFIALNCVLIITGGNHDSPGVLNAPKALLKRLRVHVIGSATENPEEELIPLKNEKGKIEAVLAAVPYLRDRDLRKATEGISYEDRIQGIREGIKQHYHQLAKLAEEKYPGIPHMACGHLYAQGATVSESEREIQIGNQAGIDEHTFPESFAYVALGHIHKAQRVGKSERILYSGSPIALSFSEKNYHKRVVVVDIENTTTTIREIPLNTHRDLFVLEGNMQEVRNALAELTSNKTLLPFIEIRVIEPHFEPELIRELDLLCDAFTEAKKGFVLQKQIRFTASENNEKENSIRHKTLDEISPLSVLESLTREYPEADRTMLQEALQTLLHDMQENGGLS
jgi:exonuclease SbcD